MPHKSWICWKPGAEALCALLLSAAGCAPAGEPEVLAGSFRATAVDTSGSAAVAVGSVGSVATFDGARWSVETDPALTFASSGVSTSASGPTWAFGPYGSVVVSAGGAWRQHVLEGSPRGHEIQSGDFDEHGRFGCLIGRGAPRALWCGDGALRERRDCLYDSFSPRAVVSTSESELRVWLGDDRGRTRIVTAEGCARGPDLSLPVQALAWTEGTLRAVAGHRIHRLLGDRWERLEGVGDVAWSRARGSRGVFLYASSTCELLVERDDSLARARLVFPAGAPTDLACSDAALAGADRAWVIADRRIWSAPLPSSAPRAPVVWGAADQAVSPVAASVDVEPAPGLDGTGPLGDRYFLAELDGQWFTSCLRPGCGVHRTSGSTWERHAQAGWPTGRVAALEGTGDLLVAVDTLGSVWSCDRADAPCRVLDRPFGETRADGPVVAFDRVRAQLWLYAPSGGRWRELGVDARTLAVFADNPLEGIDDVIAAAAHDGDVKLVDGEDRLVSRASQGTPHQELGLDARTLWVGANGRWCAGGSTASRGGLPAVVCCDDAGCGRPLEINAPTASGVSQVIGEDGTDRLLVRVDGANRRSSVWQSHDFARAGTRWERVEPADLTASCQRLARLPGRTSSIANLARPDLLCIGADAVMIRIPLAASISARLQQRLQLAGVALLLVVAVFVTWVLTRRWVLLRRLRAELRVALNDIEDAPLRDIAKSYLGAPVEPGEARSDLIDRIVAHANNIDRALELVVAAITKASDAVAKRLGERAKRLSGLEKIVGENQAFLDVVAFRRGMFEAEQRVCQIRFNGGAVGTGFLVGPDLVLTNWHVIDDHRAYSRSIKLVFDYKLDEHGTQIVAPVVASLAREDWCVDESPSHPSDEQPDDAPGRIEPSTAELDFALLRIEQRLGDTRGYFALSEDEYPFELTPGLAILQHPRGKTMKVAFGVTTRGVVNPPKTRVRHDIPTEPGASGAPITSLSHWTLVALHHGADTADPAKFNRGIPISRIAQRPKVRAALCGPANRPPQDDDALPSDSIGELSP
ncbi:trypsin-like serine peptidase [Sandaracinus amylolyticus]|uniref:trypsin-like serine peptidase n=1 Tax=Sandaracinus amylolyticus TaxID=927083 RepID=UPI001F454BF9|nr:serine protease [Sandaracinus amylolyticus]UJR84186.1 Hypothetical protein I5071_62570 [Sandaracinus amylolyticus]